MKCEVITQNVTKNTKILIKLDVSDVPTGDARREVILSHKEVFEKFFSPAEVLLVVKDVEITVLNVDSSVTHVPSDFDDYIPLSS